MEVTPQAVNGVCILITRCTRKDAFSILVADSSGNKARFSMCGCCGVESSIGHVCLIPTDGIFCCDKLVADSGKKSSGKKRAVFCSASSAVEIIADGVFTSLLIRFGSIFSSQILFSSWIAVHSRKFIKSFSIKKSGSGGAEGCSGRVPDTVDLFFQFCVFPA